MAKKHNSKSITQSFLGGLTIDDWWKLLRQNRFSISPAYWSRAAFITAMSLFNASYLRKERKLYKDLVEKIEITAPPLFILGHWRSGTTHLHNLLAQDDEQFAYPNTYQVANPRIFLCAEEPNVKRLAGLVPKKRRMDNMAFSLQTPEEDEHAYALTTLFSPYLGLVFPYRQHYYDRYFTFKNVLGSEVAQWKKEFIWFLKKLTLKYGHRSLLLKSPPHTARIRLLLDMFPNARFVHIHRNPYHVFQSTLHLMNVAYPHFYLQHPPKTTTTATYIIQRYINLHDTFFNEKALIPESQYYEVSFESLEQDPIGQMGLIYEKLHLSSFSTAEPKLQHYLKSIASYQKNKFPELSPTLRDEISQKCQRNFELWHYKP